MLVKEVAARANLTVSEVNRQIKIGNLKATLNTSVVPVRNEITEEDYERWQKTRRHRGRPKSKLVTETP